MEYLCHVWTWDNWCNIAVFHVQSFDQNDSTPQWRFNETCFASNEIKTHFLNLPTNIFLPALQFMLCWSPKLCTSSESCEKLSKKKQKSFRTNLQRRISVFQLFKSLEKIRIYGSTPTGCPDGLKPKIRGYLNVQIGLGELVGAQHCPILRNFHRKWA